MSGFPMLEIFIIFTLKINDFGAFQTKTGAIGANIKTIFSSICDYLKLDFSCLFYNHAI